MKFVIIFAAFCVVAYAAPFQESVLAEAEDMLLDMLKKEVEANKEAPAKKEVAPAAKKDDAPAKEVPVKKEAAPVKREDVTGMSYSSCETRATDPAATKPLVNRKLLRVNIPYPTHRSMKNWNGLQSNPSGNPYCTMSHDYEFYWNINTGASTCTSTATEKCVCCSSTKCYRLMTDGESCPTAEQTTHDECERLAEDHRSDDNAGCSQDNNGDMYWKGQVPTTKREVESKKDVPAKEAPAKKEAAKKDDAPAKEVPAKKEAAPAEKRDSVLSMSYDQCTTRATDAAATKPLVNRKLLRVNIPYPTHRSMKNWDGLQSTGNPYCTMSHDYEFYWNVNTGASTCTSTATEKCVCCSSTKCYRLMTDGESCPPAEQTTHDECERLAEDHRSDDNAGCSQDNYGDMYWKGQVPTTKREVEAKKDVPAKEAPVKKEAAKDDAPAKEVPAKKEAAPAEKRDSVLSMSYSQCTTRATDAAATKPLVNRKLLRVNIPYPTHRSMKNWNGLQETGNPYCTMSHDYEFYWNINTGASTCTSTATEKCVCCSSTKCYRLMTDGESCPSTEKATHDECQHLAEDHRAADIEGCSQDAYGDIYWKGQV